MVEGEVETEHHRHTQTHTHAHRHTDTHTHTQEEVVGLTFVHCSLSVDDWKCCLRENVWSSGVNDGVWVVGACKCPPNTNTNTSTSNRVDAVGPRQCSVAKQHHIRKCNFSPPPLLVHPSPLTPLSHLHPSPTFPPLPLDSPPPSLVITCQGTPCFPWTW